MQVQKSILVGHSLGGAICVQFALEYPDRADKLVLVSSAGFDKKIPLPFRLLTLPIFGKRLLRANYQHRAEASMRYYAYNKESLSNAFVEKATQFYKTPEAKRTMLRVIRQHVNFFGVRSTILKPIWKQLSAFQIPVLILWGKQDQLLSIRGAHKAMQLLPNAKLHLFDHCGHMPQIECKAEFNVVLSKFSQSLISCDSDSG